MKKRHPLRPLIILIIVILVLVALYFIARFVGEKYLAGYLNDEIDEISLSSIDIEPFDGIIRVKDFSFTDSELSIESSLVLLSIDPGEVFDLLTGAHELSAAHIDAENLIVIQEGDTFTSESFSLDAAGQFLLEDPESSLITHVRIDFEKAEAVSSEREVTFHVSELTGETFGMYKDFETLDSLQAFIDMSDEIYIACDEPQVSLSQEMRKMIASRMPLSSWLTDPSAFMGKSLSLALSFPEEKILVQEFSAVYPLIEVEGQGAFLREDPTRMSVSLEVSHLALEIREEMNMILMFFFQSIPEGAFRFVLDTTDPLAPPQIAFEPIY